MTADAAGFAQLTDSQGKIGAQGVKQGTFADSGGADEGPSMAFGHKTAQQIETDTRLGA
jgi:hypothetical protein